MYIKGNNLMINGNIWNMIPGVHMSLTKGEIISNLLFILMMI